jgi:DNA methylase
VVNKTVQVPLPIFDCSPPAATIAEMGNAAINQLRNRDRAAHDWYRFVLSFPPHLVQTYLERFGVSHDNTVLDPFCGTGTTVVDAKKLGIGSVGVEANPMAWFAGTVKLDWTPDPDRLVEVAETIAQVAEQKLFNHSGELLSLSEDAEKLILKNSISPLPLHKALTLHELIEAPSYARYRNHLLLAFAKAIVADSSNLQFGPEVGVGKAKLDAPVISAWLARVRSMSADLRYLQTLPDVPGKVIHADSRSLLQVLAPQSVEAVITSPPYPNEKDYTRTTRLESVLLGFLNTKADLRALKQNLVRSNSRNVYKGDTDGQWVAKHPKIEQIALEIESRRIELGKTSGFERVYHKAVRLYFGGMAKHLADLRTILRPGAQLAYVVGDQKSYLQVMIRTGQLLAEIAEGLGYEVINIDLFRTRIATATREHMREEVVLLRWTGKSPRSYPFSDVDL